MVDSSVIGFQIFNPKKFHQQTNKTNSIKSSKWKKHIKFSDSEFDAKKLEKTFTLKRWKQHNKSIISDTLTQVCQVDKYTKFEVR
jgi:hypothetical protein